MFKMFDRGCWLWCEFSEGFGSSDWNVSKIINYIRYDN